MKNSAIKQGFLPLCRADMDECGWDRPDLVYVTGDAYVDHPSFGTAIISRVLEAAGFRVAILSQPDYKSADAFREYPRPRLGFLVSAGNIDSMVAHYTVSRKKRSYDYYSPGGVPGKRPDRAVIVYCNRIREAFGDVPIIIGGLEASLRRHAHYDYWDNKVRRSILVDSRADILTYGMGENILLRIVKLLDRGVPVKKIRDVRGSVYLCKRGEDVHFEVAGEFDYNDLKTSKELYAKAFGVQYKNTDPVSGKAIIEYYDDKQLVANPPMPPLEREELDRVYALPYTRRVHPSYDALGGVPGIEEVKFSVTHTRGCFGACNFCAIAYHQGRTVRSRSIESVVSEAKLITEMPDFKGYIHDVGGPTANFRYPSCEKQLTDGVCSSRKCLAPKPCKNLVVDHSEYIELLKRVEALPRVKKVFIRSGIRFDYVMYDKNEDFFKRLVKNHVSGQLKVAPEHCSANVLSCMGKPPIEVYESFRKRFFEITGEVGLEQYLVPYLMSSHPGSKLEDAVELALYLKRLGLKPEQVQDFYPTPGTASTVMFYTGIDPLTGKKVYVATDPEEKKLQRALLQYTRPENAELIGNGKECLVRPAHAHSAYSQSNKADKRSSQRTENGAPRSQKRQNDQRLKAHGTQGARSARYSSSAGNSKGRSTQKGHAPTARNDSFKSKKLERGKKRG